MKFKKKVLQRKGNMYNTNNVVKQFEKEEIPWNMNHWVLFVVWEHMSHES